jgi:hypothetical protein
LRARGFLRRHPSRAALSPASGQRSNMDGPTPGQGHSQSRRATACQPASSAASLGWRHGRFSVPLEVIHPRLPEPERGAGVGRSLRDFELTRPQAPPGLDVSDTASHVPMPASTVHRRRRAWRPTTTGRKPPVNAASASKLSPPCSARAMLQTT